MNHTMMLIVLVTTCVMVQGQGHHRWGHRGHMVGLPSQFYAAYPESRVPIIPAPPADRWGWTGDNVFGGMIHGQMWSNGPFWDQRPDFGGQIGQWPASGQFGQNGQQWLPNYQNSWNTPLSANPVNNQWLFNGNGLSEQWSGKSQNTWPITDDQDYNGKDSNLNSDPWGNIQNLQVETRFPEIS